MPATPNASAGTILTPSGTTGLNRTVYSATFFRTTYQRQIAVPIFEDGERLYGSTVLRKEQRVPAAALAQSSDGTGVTYLNPVGSHVTVTPGGFIAPIGWSENEEAQVDFNMDKIAGDAAASSLAELIESNTLANFQSGTQIISNPTLDAPTLRAAIARLDQNTNGESGPGPGIGKTIYGFFSSTQRVPLMSIPEVNSAEARGDSENPYVKGVWVRGFGIVANITSVIAQDANGYHNGVCLAEAVTVRWNTRSRIKRQDYEYRNAYYGFANLGSALVYDARLVVVRTT